TELNNAQGENRSLSLEALGMDTEAERHLMSLWASCPFRCDARKIKETCMETYFGGFQIRSIPVIMEPRQGAGFAGERKQQIVLNFDGKGTLSDVCIALASTKLRGETQAMEVTEARKRLLILDFVEQFRTAYNRKDTAFMERIFSEDALIITGTVSKAPLKSADGPAAVTFREKEKARINVLSKEQYLKKLGEVFRKNEWINVLFDNIKIQKHGKKETYGVQLAQTWTSSTYGDKGYLFLLWDFEDIDNPKIHVRAWQPDGTPEVERYGLADFKGF
ncbi:MAG: nuclear transport factor 2 family protein, partial [Tannerella sp.]|nr:nuclear transport factor 2 family protein [Tannerella sp.]